MFRKIVAITLLLSFFSIKTGWQNAKTPFNLRELNTAEEKYQLKKELKKGKKEGKDLRMLTAKKKILKEAPRLTAISDVDQKKYTACFLGVKNAIDKKKGCSEKPDASETFFKILKAVYQNNSPSAKETTELKKFYLNTIFTKASGNEKNKKKITQFVYHSIELKKWCEMSPKQKETLDYQARIANPQGDLEKINKPIYIGKPYPKRKKVGLFCSGGVLVPVSIAGALGLVGGVLISFYSALGCAITG